MVGMSPSEWASKRTDPQRRARTRIVPCDLSLSIINIKLLLRFPLRLPLRYPPRTELNSSHSLHRSDVPTPMSAVSMASSLSAETERNHNIPLLHLDKALDPPPSLTPTAWDPRLPTDHSPKLCHPPNRPLDQVIDRTKFLRRLRRTTNYRQRRS